MDNKQIKNKTKFSKTFSLAEVVRGPRLDESLYFSPVLNAAVVNSETGRRQTVRTLIEQ